MPPATRRRRSTSPRPEPRRDRDDRGRRHARTGGADGALAVVDGGSRSPPRRLRAQSSAALRSVYPVVLGLGGWFLGVLVVLTAMPGVALDDEPLALLSVGVPIGLGIYLAWVQRDRTARPGQPGSSRRRPALSSAGGSVSTRRPGSWRCSPRSSERRPPRTALILELTWEQSARRSAAAESPRGSTLLGT